MFENLLERLLFSYLGTYIKEFNQESLKVGMWGGNVSMEQLSLKPEAFSDLGLPLVLEQGTIGKLVIKIPWHNLYK